MHLVACASFYISLAMQHQSSFPHTPQSLLQDQPYAEWVGVRARVALLEAHAHCAALAAAAGDPDGPTARVVRQAQAPHRQLLLDGWMG